LKPTPQSPPAISDTLPKGHDPRSAGSRLKVLEEEILRLSKLAAESSDQLRQDQYWNLARDLQREARALRAGAHTTSEAANEAQPKPTNRTQSRDLHHLRFAAV
jgi:hypothetical protein